MLFNLKQSYDSRQMYEAVLPLLDRMGEVRPINAIQMAGRAVAAAARAEYLKRMGPAPSPEWQNLSDLDQAVTANLASGRAASAAALLERAYPPDRAPGSLWKRWRP